MGGYAFMGYERALLVQNNNLVPYRVMRGYGL